MSLFPGKSTFSLSTAKAGLFPFTGPLNIVKSAIGGGKDRKPEAPPVTAVATPVAKPVQGKILNTDINAVKKKRAAAQAVTATARLGNTTGQSSLLG